MRALAVLPALAQRHELLLLAGRDALDALTPEYNVKRIPMVGFYYGRGGRISNWRTATRNLPAVLDLKLGGAGVDMVADALREFRPDVVLSDSECYTLHAARRLAIPRIIFDHFGLLVFCRPEMSRRDDLVRRGQALIYRLLYGEPDRAVVSGFFGAPAQRDGVTVVGPVIRREVRSVAPARGPHLLAYFSKGEQEYTPQVERALLGLDVPVRVYGTQRRGLHDNVQYKPLCNLAFIEDLASCRAVFATTGNQLIGEVLFFGKPLLGMPIDCLEQRLNAAQIERLGIGLRIARRAVTAERLRAFLAREAELAARAQRRPRDGAAEAVEAIERYARELTGRHAAGAAPDRPHDTLATKEPR